MENLEKTVNAKCEVPQSKSFKNEAFGAVVRDNWDKVFSRVYSLLKNREDAEEVTQDTFMRAQMGMGSFRGDCSMSTWLHRIATNLARNKYWYWWRRKRDVSMSMDAPLNDESNSTLADIIPSDALTPIDSAESSEFSEILPRAISKLEDKYAEVLILRSQYDMSYEEISKKLNITVGTVKSRLSRAREQLRAELLQFK